MIARYSSNILTILTVSILAVSSEQLLYAAESSGTIPIEYKITEPKIANGPKVIDLITEFLAQNKWSEGMNSELKDGNKKTFFIAVGVGTIAARRDSPDYISSRTNAFKKAFLTAQKNLVQYLEADIKASMQLDYKEPSASREQARIEELTANGMALQAAKAAAQALKNDVSDKLPYQVMTTAAAQGERLLTHELNKKIKAAGFDPDKPVESQVIQKILKTEEFKHDVEVVANARVAGLKAFKTFEVLREGQQGEIGVVAIYSERLHALANALFSGNTALVPIDAPRSPIQEQIPSDTQILMGTFGVDAKVDENGQMTLVAYGQAGAKSDSSRSQEAADAKAKLDAMSAIRFFAGAMVQTLESAKQAETMTELEANTINSKIDESYENSIKATMDQLKISGMTTIKRWRERHPLTGHYIAGQVVTWQPSAADVAVKMKNKLASAPPKNPGAESKKSNTNPNSIGEAKTNSGVRELQGSHQTEGAEGSRDF